MCQICLSVFEELMPSCFIQWKHKNKMAAAKSMLFVGHVMLGRWCKSFWGWALTGQINVNRASGYFVGKHFIRGNDSLKSISFSPYM